MDRLCALKGNSNGAPPSLQGEELKINDNLMHEVGHNFYSIIPTFTELRPLLVRLRRLA